MSTADEEVNSSAKLFIEKLTNDLEELVLAQALFTQRFDVKQKRYELTKEERDARNEWNQARDEFLEIHQDLCAQYAAAFKCKNQEDIVSSSILPAMYNPDPRTTSRRSAFSEKRHKRYYPHELEKWDDFSKLFDDKFDDDLPKMIKAPLTRSMDSSTTLTNESDEAAFLKEYVFAPFSRSGLMCRSFQTNGHFDAVVGRPDEVCYSIQRDADTKAQKTLVFEAKSLQNMILPNDFKTLKDHYEEAVRNQIQNEQEQRSKYWSQICHPLAQEFAYMVDNGVRYGALFCACKAYFIHLEGSGNKIDKVKVTDAYIAGQKNFLRAWACVIRAADKSPSVSSLELPQNCWLEKTPIKSAAQAAPGIENHPGETSHEDDEPTSNGGSGGGHSKRNPSRNSSRGAPASKKPRRKSPQRTTKKGNTQAALMLSPPQLVPSTSAESEEGDTNWQSVPSTPSDAALFDLFDFEQDFVKQVDFRTLTIGKVLGRGRNGDVFESEYNGETVAVKQFDLSKNFDSYQKEVEAYVYLKDAWGELVPTPKFIAESPSGMVRFIGLQKGTPVDDDTFHEQFGKVIGKLKSDYNFQPLDYSHGCNCVAVDGDNGRKKLLLIDLESWEYAGNT